MEHVVRDFLQERENRAIVMCNTILYVYTPVCGIETTVSATDKIYLKKGPGNYIILNL